MQPKQEHLGFPALPPNAPVSQTSQPVLMTVTPQLAKQWLERNVHNRPLSEVTVIAYALDMLEGRWRYNGAAIQFDSNGTLIDGQHRLKACVEADVPFQTIVVFDLPPEVMRTIDIGKPRTSGHIAHLEGAQNASCACAVAGLILIHQKYGIRHMNDPRCQPTKTQVVEAVGRLPGIDGAVAQAKLLARKIAAPRLVGFCWYAFAQQDRTLADRFFTELANGLSLSPTNPVYHLRERLLADRQAKAKLPQVEIVALFFKAWLYYRENRPIRKLFWKSDGGSPEKFPDLGGTL